jgi:uncharacterized membrane protein YkvA (DUF1232 family)
LTFLSDFDDDDAIVGRSRQGRWWHNERVLFQMKRWARAVKRDLAAIWLAARDPRVPWYAKLMAAAVVAYALSPIDLIPDFIPVLGYLDDLLIVPAGILLTVRVIPADLLTEFRAQVGKRSDRYTAPPQSGS